MERTPFTPGKGITYRNQGGGLYECIGIPKDQDGCAIMRNTASGWTLAAHGVGIYDDGSIDWDYSTGGRFEKGVDPETVARAAVEKWGKSPQVDMAIEEMSELTKALLKDRRAGYVPGQQDAEKIRADISEEMADVYIMLLQLEIIFQNGDEWRGIFNEKIDRLQGRTEG